jgi:DMSO reductase anchor subunit
MNVQLPLILSTLCQRLALGTYIIALLAIWIFGYTTDISTLSIAALAFFCIGIVGSMLHRGAPQKLDSRVSYTSAKEFTHVQAKESCPGI